MRFVDYRTMSDHDILNLGNSAGRAPSGEDDRPVDHWVTINRQHVSITVPQGKSVAQGKPVAHGKCPPQKKAFFEALGPIFKAMGKAAKTDPAFIAALSAYESSWLAQHALERHNPFGLTAAGGKNLAFPSYEAAASYWLYHASRNRKGYANVVSGAATIDEFTSALHEAGYNAVNPQWTSDIVKIYRTSITPFAARCGF